MSAGPFVLPIHDLQRTPGAGRNIELAIPAPHDLGTSVIGVPEGELVELDLTVQSTGEGVYVTGTIGTRLTGECVRCLDPLDRRLDLDVSELYLFPESVQRAIDDGDEEATEMLRTDGETLDLEPMVRDTIVTDLPFRPLCRPDCPGLCPVCGIRMEDAEPGHEHREVDPRFAALAVLLEGESEEGALEGGE
ncbi:MAG TPA: YceD family protein [Actinomycetaceae bacterium]|nr:YceD family protein [Actinomycetaceae bacterium]